MTQFHKRRQQRRNRKRAKRTNRKQNQDGGLKPMHIQNYTIIFTLANPG